MSRFQPLCHQVHIFGRIIDDGPWSDDTYGSIFQSARFMLWFPTSMGEGFGDGLWRHPFSVTWSRIKTIDDWLKLPLFFFTTRPGGSAASRSTVWTSPFIVVLRCRLLIHVRVRYLWSAPKTTLFSQPVSPAWGVEFTHVGRKPAEDPRLYLCSCARGVCTSMISEEFFFHITRVTPLWIRVTFICSSYTNDTKSLNVKSPQPQQKNLRQGRRNHHPSSCKLDDLVRWFKYEFGLLFPFLLINF